MLSLTNLICYFNFTSKQIDKKVNLLKQEFAKGGFLHFGPHSYPFEKHKTVLGTWESWHKVGQKAGLSFPRAQLSVVFFVSTQWPPCPVVKERKCGESWGGGNGPPWWPHVSHHHSFAVLSTYSLGSNLSTSLMGVWYSRNEGASLCLSFLLVLLWGPCC